MTRISWALYRLRGEDEVLGGGQPFADPDTRGLRAMADQLRLHRLSARRDAGDRVAPGIVREGPELGPLHGHLSARQRLPILIGDPALDGALSQTRPGSGRDQQEGHQDRPEDGLETSHHRAPSACWSNSAARTPDTAYGRGSPAHHIAGPDSDATRPGTARRTTPRGRCANAERSAVSGATRGRRSPQEGRGPAPGRCFSASASEWRSADGRPRPRGGLEPGPGTRDPAGDRPLQRRRRPRRRGNRMAQSGAERPAAVPVRPLLINVHLR